jgi:hypothetical protein
MMVVASGVRTVSEASTLSPPSVESQSLSSSKWEREYAAFRKMLPKLLATHRGQYVAIHNGQIVGSGPVKLAVALDTLAKIGNEDIHVGFVSEAPEPPARSGVRRSARSGE